MTLNIFHAKALFHITLQPDYFFLFQVNPVEFVCGEMCTKLSVWTKQ